MDSDIINSILEFPTNYSFGTEKIEMIDPNEKLIKIIIDFLQVNNINKVILSHSGGVDSNVVFFILKWYQKNYDNEFQFYTATIDYNCRTESKDETQFVEILNSTFGIQNFNVNTNIKRKDGTTKRKVFEETSQKIRFELFNKIKIQFGEMGVILAHHFNDESENIIGNIFKGLGPMSLSGVSKISFKFDTCIYRPLLDVPKKEIFDFAHKYNIPYFKNTTPSWSKRGKQREELFPLLENIYGENFENNIHKLAKKSNELCSIFNKMILEPILKSIKFFKYGCYFDVSKIKDLNEYVFWESLFLEIFHNHLSVHMPKYESINKFIKSINTLTNFAFDINKEYFVLLNNNKLIFMDKNINEKYISAQPFISENISENKSEILDSFLDGKLTYWVDESFNFSNINKNHILRKKYNLELNTNIIKDLILPSSCDISNPVLISYSV